MRAVSQLLKLRSLLFSTGEVLGGRAEALPLLSTLQQTAGIKKQANELRIGNVVEHNGRLMQVVSLQNRAMGRQLGNVNFELRDVVTKSKFPAKFRPYDQVECVRLEGRRFQCLYIEGNQVHCMDPDTYEQLAVDRDLFGSGASFLVEGQDVTLNFHGGDAVTGEVPTQVKLRVVEAAPTMKGETAAPSHKRAVVEGGVEVQVPPFVQTGDVIVVNTLDRSFVRRSDKE